ncbi:glycoside hydrolase family 13 domain protein [Candidatus Magnetoovum chiemensis]|nr:glycoside hydrolase family 13 domain protein [Candidatus Magnetoovum chiemensis]
MENQKSDSIEQPVTKENLIELENIDNEKLDRVQPVGIKKEYVKDKKTCTVTFTMPKEGAIDAKSISIAGDFNNWNIFTHQMNKNSNGDYTITIELDCGKEYQYKYCIDGKYWENDWKADKYVLSDFNTENSVVIV